MVGSCVFVGLHVPLLAYAAKVFLARYPSGPFRFSIVREVCLLDGVVKGMYVFSNTYGNASVSDVCD